MAMGGSVWNLRIVPLCDSLSVDAIRDRVVASIGNWISGFI
jgi:hypothetical protein